MTQHTLIVEPHNSGLRLDKFISVAIPELSRSRVQVLVAEGFVTRDGSVSVDPAQKVKTGQEWKVIIPETKPLLLEAQEMPLTIVYEDKDMLVIDKPPGLTVHPAPGHDDKTLVNALLAHCGSSLSGIGGVARPGIVHRLDKDTSGLIVVAKHDAAHAALAEQLAARTLKRTYSAVVWGVPHPTKGTISTQLGRSPTHRKKMAVLRSGGKHAVTHYATEETFMIPGEKEKLASMMSCQLETGRTHQIRVHLAHLGHPLIGDTTYGHPSRKHISMVSKLDNKDFLAYIKHFPRQALHARQLVLQHPASGEILTFQSDIPSDMGTLINRLGILK